LEGIEKINKKINDQVKVELLNYQKNKLKSQLNTGDYIVTLFGAGSSGKTSIARSLLKNIVGQTSAKIGTTKQINSYKIRIPILKRNINIVDTPGLFEPSKLGEQREKATIIQASNSDLVLFVLDQDINKYENYLIKELLNIGKKIIVVLNKGIIEQFGTPHEIYTNPNNIFVAEFIGSPKMNIVKINKEHIINSNTIELFKNKITFENLDFKDEIYLGIRPEDISIKNDCEIKLDVKVDLIENLGFEKIIYAKLSNTQVIIKSSEDTINQPLKISFSKDKVLFFDKNKNRIR